jgi:hypothetical protein
MKNRMMLLAAVVTCATMWAIPAVSKAGEPQVDYSNGKSPLTFVVTGGYTEFRVAGEPTFACTSTSGIGKFSTASTGELGLTFSGCTTSFFGFPAACASTGQPTGTIKYGTSIFHYVYLTDAKTTPGILITAPTGGLFTTLSCGVIGTLEIKGNGIMGHLVAPKCGETSGTETFNFSAIGASQVNKQITGTGTAFDLTGTTVGSGTSATAADVTELRVAFSESTTLTCV